MKKAKTLILVTLLLTSASPALARPKPMKLWAVQKPHWLTREWKVQGNTITLEHKAKIIAVKSDAPSFCIWSKGTQVLCGGGTFTIVGQTLEPGRYTVYPFLRRAQPESKVEILLQYVEP